LIPTLRFTHIHRGELNTIDSILSSVTEESIKDLCDRYVLISHTNDKLTHECVIVDICEDDIMYTEGPNKEAVIEEYNNILEKHGPSLVNKIIVSDAKHIMNKIKAIIDFTLDKVYKCDEISIYWAKYKISPDEVSSTPGLIYATLQSCYHITEHMELPKSYNAKIKRRVGL